MSPSHGGRGSLPPGRAGTCAEGVTGSVSFQFRAPRGQARQPWRSPWAKPASLLVRFSPWPEPGPAVRHMPTAGCVGPGAGSTGRQAKPSQVLEKHRQL